MTPQRERLTQKLKRLSDKFDYMTRGRVTLPASAIRTRNEILIVRQELRELDRMEAERLALAQAPIDEVLEIVAIPLLADVMNDLVAGVDGMLRRKGLQETVFGDYARQIRRASLDMVDTLEHSNEGLPKLLDVNDALVDAIRKKLMSFIKQHLCIKDDKQKKTKKKAEPKAPDL